MPIFPSRSTLLVSGTHLQEGKATFSTQVLQMMHFNKYTNWNSGYNNGFLGYLVTLT